MRNTCATYFEYVNLSEFIGVLRLRSFLRRLYATQIATTQLLRRVYAYVKCLCNRPLSVLIRYDEFASSLFINTLLNCCHTRVASSRSPHGVHEKCRTPRCTPYGLLERRSISVASPLDAVGSPRSPCDGVHFVHAQSTRRGTAL